MNKQINSRIQHKHDIEENWIKAINFIPMNGEIIIYDKDNNYSYNRFKIGDGITPINNLDFISKGIGEDLGNNIDFIQMILNNLPKAEGVGF